MPRNKITDLNNHLFEMLERLKDDDLTQEELNQEIDRAKAMVGVSDALIESFKVTVRAAKLMHNGITDPKDLPMLDSSNGKQTKDTD